MAVAVDMAKIREFTAKPLLGVLASHYPSGSIQAVPVWYDYDGEEFIVNTGRTAVKVRNVLADDRVTLCVVDTSHPTSSPTLTVLGRVKLVDDRDQESRKRMARRYLGPEDAERFIKQAAHRDVVVLRIRPEKFLQAP